MRISTILSMFLIIIHLLISQSTLADTVQDTFICLDKKDWQDCNKIATRSGNKVLINIILSQQLLDSNYKKNTFATAVKFIQENPHWPQNDKIIKLSEKYLSYDTDPATIVNWFNKNEPMTGNGYKFYAISSGRLQKNSQKLVKIIKNGWIYGTFTLEEESKYLRNFKDLLNEEDYIKKIDENLWGGDVANATKYMQYISKGYQDNFTAQIAIIKKSLSSDELFQSVEEKYYTSGLLFRYLDSKKKEVPNDQSIYLFKKVKMDKMHSNSWYKLQSYYAREFIDQKDFASSYAIISIPLASHNSDVGEAQWLSGWLALRFLHEPDTAIAHFHKFAKLAKKPISVSRGQYWLGRAYEAKGNQEQADIFYNNAAKYPYSFYGQLANVDLKKHRLILPKRPAYHKHTTEHDNIIKAIKYLAKYNKSHLALSYAKSLIASSLNPSEIALITDIISSNGNIHYMVEIAKTACQHNVCIDNYAFPTPYNKEINNTIIESALAYSIIRQESVFNQYAVSTANAMGLMQLIESTACSTAKSIKLQCQVKKLTTDPKYNIILGSNHLKQLLEKYNGSYLLSIIAYNAGSHKVTRWIDLFGDPRNLKNLRQTVDWIELIPYSETRNYAQRVLENIQVYKTILNKNSPLRLKQYLEHTN